MLAVLSLSACVDLASRDEPQRPSAQGGSAHAQLTGHAQTETIAEREPTLSGAPDAAPLSAPPSVGAALPPLESRGSQDAGPPISAPPAEPADRDAFTDWQSEPYAQRRGDAERGRRLMIDNGTLETPYMSCGVPEAAVRLAGLDREW
ncbi:MAG TPA: hypothetical protein VMF89_10235, partial [Polyangiales bacterium]|nr:hypothetical protein [Polyangiales bacterium]